jgi:hypothetical protein
MGPGREAATVRQVVLVVVLVGAAFLGGAFVNGPGLRWVQTQVLGSLGLDEGGEIATVDLKGGAGPDKAGDKANPGEPARGPVAPVPGLVAEPGAKAEASERRPIRREASEGAGAPRPPTSTAPAPPRSIPDPTAPADPPPLSAPVAGPARPPRDPDVTRASAPATSSASPATAPTPADRDREARPTLVDSLASLMPSPAPAPPEGLAPPAPTPAPAPTPSPSSPAPNRPGDDDWATLARKMQVLGVSRFTIEGQPGGRVVFSCLIPLAGRQAVAQRFEAEGEDAPQAARAALRRVALWRAAQSSQPSQQQSR